MRIAQISTLCTPVRQEGSASIEGLVWLLSRELVRMGHEVTVFACAGSEPHGELVVTLPGPYGSNGSPDDWKLCEWLNLCRAVEQAARFDVLHSHAYLWGLPLEAISKAPLVHTLHVCPYENEARLRSLVPDAAVVGISRSQWSCFPGLEPRAVIHHGIDIEQFPFCATGGDYLCFLGRFTPGKGPRVAVEAARTLGLRLLLAGPANDYYRSQVAPLVDGRLVQYVGSVTGRARARLLGGARALLYPIQEPEPFGLVQVEAMMCGTPVVAMRLGAVPEVVDEGVTGFSTTNPEEFPGLIERAFTLDRGSVHARAVGRFSGERMARQYAELYQKVVSGATRGRGEVPHGDADRG
jgi:glycosyltransferase involved in cell wall biosynthesis